MSADEEDHWKDIVNPAEGAKLFDYQRYDSDDEDTRKLDENGRYIDAEFDLKGIGTNRVRLLINLETTEDVEYTVTREGSSKSGVETNDGEATAEYDDSPNVPEEDPPVLEEPSLKVTKTAYVNGESIDGQSVYEYDEITYKIKVENTGAKKIKDVVLTDEMLGIKGAAAVTVGDLDANDGKAGGTDEKEYSYKYVVTEEDRIAGTVKNVAYAEGTCDGDKIGDYGTVENEVENGLRPASLKVEKTSDVAKDTKLKVGDVVNYTITITNTGGHVVSGIYVVDEKTGRTDATGETETTDDDVLVPDKTTLDPNESTTVTTSYTVTEEDLIAGNVVNTATANGIVPDDDDSPVTDTGSKEDPTEDADPGLEVTKEASLPTGMDKAELGTTITYTVTVHNTGNLTLKDIVVDDPLEGVTTPQGQSNTIASLSPDDGVDGSGDDEAVLTYYYVVSEADLIAGEVENTATATADDPTDPDKDVTDTSEKVTVPTEDADPSLKVTKTSSYDGKDKGKDAVLGQTITYTVTVQNTGNLTLKDVVVSDELDGIVPAEDQPEKVTLTPDDGEDGTGTDQAVFTYTYTVTQADVIAGEVTNVATAEAADPTGDKEKITEESTITDNVEDPAPSYVVTKTVKAVSGDDDVPSLGETVTYKITVLNNGNVDIKNIVIEDEKTGNIDGKELEIAGPIAPNESESVEVSYTVQESDIVAGKVVNTAIAEADDYKGDPIDEDENDKKSTDETDTDAIDNQLTVTKTSDFTPTKDKPGLELGDTVTYTLQIHNGGNVTISDITLTDYEVSKVWDGADVPALAPGTDSKEYTCTHVVTQEDIRKGSIYNSAQAVGKDPKGTETTSNKAEKTDPTVQAKASLFVEKTASSEGPFDLGDTIDYTVTVTNNGNQTISNITVEDELTGNVGDKAWTIDSLEPGGSRDISTSYTITEKDIIDQEDILNSATATGFSPENDTDTPDVTPDPGEKSSDVDDKKPVIVISKTSDKDGEVVDINDVIHYTITVKNEGNLTVNNVRVEDEKLGKVGDDAWTVDELTPEGYGKSEETFEIDYVVQEKDIENGSVYNSATATGEFSDGTPLDESDFTEVYTQIPTPILTLEEKIINTPKNGKKYVEGETIEYEITVKNEGNVTLLDVVVKDPLTGLEKKFEKLEPGESQTLYTDHVVTGEEARKGIVENPVTADAVNAATGEALETAEAQVDAPAVEEPDVKTGDQNSLLLLLSTLMAAVGVFAAGFLRKLMREDV